MTNVTLKGNPVDLSGNPPQVGDKVPDFQLTGVDLGKVSLSDSDGKVRILSIVPSIDTGICALQTKHFNQDIDNSARQCRGLHHQCGHAVRAKALVRRRRRRKDDHAQRLQRRKIRSGLGSLYRRTVGCFSPRSLRFRQRPQCRILRTRARNRSGAQLRTGLSQSQRTGQRLTN